MARLYADEQFPLPVVKCLRILGHNILTAQEAGKGNQEIPDEAVLAFAIKNNRAILTLNRRHFVRLHRSQPAHTGIIVCSEDLNWERLATRIHEAISVEETLSGKLIGIHRSNS